MARAGYPPLGRKDVLALLNEEGIAYRLVEHQAIHTIDETEKSGLAQSSSIPKNLFLRDAKGTNHFLVSIEKDKSLNLKRLREQLGSTPLSFASVQRLERYLGLMPGAVTPFGLFNYTAEAIPLVLDEALQGNAQLGFHPIDNRATVFLRLGDLEQLLIQRGRRVIRLMI